VVVLTSLPISFLVLIISTVLPLSWLADWPIPQAIRHLSSFMEIWHKPHLQASCRLFRTISISPITYVFPRCLERYC
jgi:hypothetical protein